MWESLGDTTDLALEEGLFEVADTATFDETINWENGTGQKQTYSSVRTKNYVLHTFDQDVPSTMGLSVNRAPYVSGSTTLAMVRTKIDN